MPVLLVVVSEFFQGEADDIVLLTAVNDCRYLFFSSHFPGHGFSRAAGAVNGEIRRQHPAQRRRKNAGKPLQLLQSNAFVEYFSALSFKTLKRISKSMSPYL